jgi:epoxyqueuosine reductase
MADERSTTPELSAWEAEPDGKVILTNHLKAEALRLGFDQVGIAPAVAPPGYAHFLDWLEAGHAAGMEYMKRQAASRAHPDYLLEGVRSVVVGIVVYGKNDPERETLRPTQGKVARYAQGADYHCVLRDKLEALLAWLRAASPGIRGRSVVDTAPLLERDFARLAGLGWIGKNTMLINRRLGSFTFLGALLVDAELAYDNAHEADHCGRCTRCLDTCPTEAFAGPYDLDSRRCISYQTIEHRGVIADERAAELHGWVFGCDICQDVCPWNRKAPSGRERDFDARSEWTDPDLLEWLTWGPSDWSARLTGTALLRSRRVGLLRNAALVLGTRRLPEAVAPLAALLDDRGENPVVRASAAWALGRIATRDALAALGRHSNDLALLVRDAVKRALDASATPADAGSADRLAHHAERDPPAADRAGARLQTKQGVH